MISREKLHLRTLATKVVTNHIENNPQEVSQLSALGVTDETTIIPSESDTKFCEVQDLISLWKQRGVIDASEKVFLLPVTTVKDDKVFVTLLVQGTVTIEHSVSVHEDSDFTMGQLCEALDKGKEWHISELFTSEVPKQDLASA